MAKTKFKGNAEKFLKKVEKDFQALGLAVAEGTTDWLALTFDDIKQKGFVDGRALTLAGLYFPVPGGNVASVASPKVMAFHKTKIVNRDDSFPQAFDKVSYRKQSQNGRNVLIGSNGVAHIAIEKTGNTRNPKGQKIEISFSGHIGNNLKNHEFGIGVRKRPIVFRGLTRMQNRWKKFIAASASKTFRKRNKVKV